MTRLLLVAVHSMSLVSVISTMKVERPLAKSSEAVEKSNQRTKGEFELKIYSPPILVKIASNKPILTDVAGT
jgi:hypothetical protein